MKHKITQHKFENGLELIICQKSNVPLISMNLMYKVGSKNELKGKTGIAHLSEHLMFEGTKKYPKGEFDKIITSVAGTNNAYTTYDWTSYTMSMPSVHLETALELESDRLFNFSPSQEALDVQKSVVIEEIKQTIQNQPYGKWREKLASIAFNSECTYFWEVPGFIQDIEKFKLEDIMSFNLSFYNPINAKLILAGDLEIESTINLVEKYFNHKRENIKAETTFNNDFLNKSGYISFKDQVPLNATFIATHLDGFENLNENIIAELFCNIIGLGRSSILISSLVFEDQIASQVGAFLDRREYSSLLTFYIIANKEEQTNDEICNELIKVIARIKETGITDYQLQKAKNFVWSQMAMELEQNYALADTIGFYSMFYNSPEEIHNVKEKYDNITLEEMNRFINSKINILEYLRVDVEKN